MIQAEQQPLVHFEEEVIKNETDEVETNARVTNETETENEAENITKAEVLEDV